MNKKTDPDLDDSRDASPPPQIRSWGPSTKAVHAGRGHPYPRHAITMPLFQTATYTFEDTSDLTNFMEARMWGRSNGRTEYGRYGNPTVSAVEARLAALDNAGDAILFSSGMAAITTVLLAMLPTGCHLILTDDCYRRTRQFCTRILTRLGIASTVVPMGDYAAIERAITPKTRLIISESPTNPYLRLLDLEKISAIARRSRIKTLVDSTFATPINQRPLDWGIDLVIHSATKYLAGHNDLLAGVVAGEAGLIHSLRQTLGVMGAIADPHSAFLLDRGLKTLGLRIGQQNQSGLAVANFLENHRSVERVWYPGLPSHPDYGIGQRTMEGYGGVVSFSVQSDLAGTSRFIDALRIPIIAPSLGAVETLVEQPALMSYYELSTSERLEVGIPDNLVRLSLGVEDPVDLIQDLEQALDSLL